MKEPIMPEEEFAYLKQIDALRAELAARDACIADARTVINRGVSIVTTDQLGQWAGVRAWLEMAPYQPEDTRAAQLEAELEAENARLTAERDAARRELTDAVIQAGHYKAQLSGNEAEQLRRDYMELKSFYNRMTDRAMHYDEKYTVARQSRARLVYAACELRSRYEAEFDKAEFLKDLFNDRLAEITAARTALEEAKINREIAVQQAYECGCDVVRDARAAAAAWKRAAEKWYASTQWRSNIIRGLPCDKQEALWLRSIYGTAQDKRRNGFLSYLRERAKNKE